LLFLPLAANFAKEMQNAKFAEIYSHRHHVSAIVPVSYEASGPNEISVNTEALRWYASPEWWLCILGFPTLIVVILQTVATRRSAKATEDTVKLARETSRHQLRAYLSVSIGSAIYQERRPAENGGDLKFECRPLLVNTGQTYAKNLRFKARSAILSVPLPSGMHLPEGFDDGIGEGFMAPQQQANMFATVEGFCQDSEIDNIKKMSGNMGLYTWGLVTYKDIFGETHFTRFCHHIYWSGSEVRGLYVPGRNDAD